MVCPRVAVEVPALRPLNLLQVTPGEPQTPLTVSTHCPGDLEPSPGLFLTTWAESALPGRNNALPPPTRSPRKKWVMQLSGHLLHRERLDKAVWRALIQRPRSTPACDQGPALTPVIRDPVRINMSNL